MGYRVTLTLAIRRWSGDDIGSEIAKVVSRGLPPLANRSPKRKREISFIWPPH
jgi:hypothetical protein